MSIERQLVEYFELQDELHGEITPEEVVGSPVRVTTPIRSNGNAWWAVAAAAVVILLLGVVGVFAGVRSGEDATAEQSASTSIVENGDALAIAVSFTQARTDGDADAVVARMADDANVDMGPAVARSDVAAEMRWQQAAGLIFTFDRCESRNATNDAEAASFSCFVTWTGSVAASLGHGEDVFEYAIDVADDRVVSVVLVNLGSYPETTWRPFRDWILEQHPDDAATMYTSDGHAVLIDESIELWRLRTAEFVVEQSNQNAVPGKEAAQIRPFVEQGSLDVTWVKYTGRDGTQPYGIDSYDAGVYTTVTEDGLYQSTDAVTWMFEPVTPDARFPSEVSDDGQWGMVQDRFFTGTLLQNVDGEWQFAPRPPQADPTGDWVWMRSLASSDDIVLVIGGLSDGREEPYPVVDEASYWRIDSAGVWQATGPKFDDTFRIRAVPGGGFAYTQDGALHTSGDGLTWIDRGTTSFDWWEEGVFPGLVHVTVDDATGSQVWTSPDAVSWTYQFTAPQNSSLSVTNRGIVATRWGEENPEKPTATFVESWLLNGDRQTWTTMARFTVPGCTECATWVGAIGDVMFLARSTSDSSAVMHIAELPSK